MLTIKYIQNACYLKLSFTLLINYVNMVSDKMRIKNINMWFNKKGIMNSINNIIEKFANRFPHAYKSDFRFLFPTHGITYEMGVAK